MRDKKYPTSERDVYERVMRYLNRKGYNVTGATKHKLMVDESRAHPDVMVMISENRYIGLRCKGEHTQLTEAEREAVKANRFSVIRCEQDLFNVLETAENKGGEA